jgi:excisionase family DNA binding protein
MDHLVGVKELKEVFGPPESWWYSQAEAGKIPSYKVGKYRRFRLCEIQAWLEQQRQGPRPAGR